MPLMYTGTGTPGANVPTTTETVVVSIAGVTLPRAGLTVAIEASGSLLAGAAATAGTIRCRRGVDATGALVGTAETPPLTAGVSDNWAGSWNDTPGELANGSYVITIQQTAATGNGTSQAAVAQVFVGTPN